ncbi:PQQ-binding-like beta-propeller repeat protein [Cellulomonas sp. S1-8]|uniref:outer membrane protein assembly factor BamB family protein n=1 Tax=Cellulomonas sp. S1-8 TaxID=2904790 RepID=UPI002243F868|nr:PQQ-binding-like beta-propeller repeat protein [Cellulomonas sp. S1-8]UZN03435.1 PQQ-binding-like beta-propeller repeat protein [Cellulomonas sp. S1-8]
MLQVELVEDEVLDQVPRAFGPTRGPGHASPARRPGGRSSGSTTPDVAGAPPSSAGRDGPVAPDAPPPVTPHPRRTRRLLVGTAAAVALAVALAGAQVAVDARERAYLADLARLPGVVAPLDAPPGVRWSGDVADVLATGVRTVDGSSVVGVRTAADGSRTVVAVDVATGEARWEQPAAGPATRPSPDAQPVLQGCQRVPGDGEHVSCLVSDLWRVVELSRWTAVAPTSARLLVLDVVDGSVMSDLVAGSAADGWATASAVLGTSTVLAGTTPGGDVAVRAVDRDGALLWQVVRVGAATGPWTPLSVQRLDDAVAVMTSSEVVVLDGATGEVRRTHTVDESAGGYVTSWDPDAGRLNVVQDGTTTVVRADADVTVHGTPVPTAIDDGSVPGLVLTDDVDLRAWGRDGQALWTAPVPSTWNATVLDGRVHLQTSTSLVTIDARTGDELWRSWEGDQGGAVLTDGRHLFRTVDRDGASSGELDLVALDPADGSQLWRGPLPDDVRDLRALEGTLLARTTSGGPGGSGQVLAVLG